MKIRKLYPNGNQKAFNVTYDDGVIQDKRFVNLLNKYKIIGTFNLNSRLTVDQFTWMHESGMEVSRLTKDQVIELYNGHEIAAHSLTHPVLTDLEEDIIMKELIKDKENLEQWFGFEIKGFAYPFAAYNELTTECVKKAGYTYARIGDETEDFSFSNDPFVWQPSFFHTEDGLREFVTNFSQCDDELALCQIVGHTYEFDIYEMWDEIKDILSYISSKKDVWFASTIDIVEYLEAMKNVEINKNEIINSSNSKLWFEVNGEIIYVKGKSSKQYK